MARKISMAAAVFVAILAAAAMVQITNAANHTIEDSTVWKAPKNTDYFDTWANYKDFDVADIIVMDFVSEADYISQLLQSVYNDLNTNDKFTIFAKRKDRKVVLPFTKLVTPASFVPSAIPISVA